MKMNVSETGTISLDCPPVMPFGELTSCPACGAREDHWWRRFLRRVQGKNQKSLITVGFCKGSKPPTETRTRFFFSDAEITNECAGLLTPHLHVRCLRCNAGWFSETRTAL